MNRPGKRNTEENNPAEQGFERLLEAVYDELRRIAHFHRLGERPDLTLQTTALVHEAYLRLINSRTVPKPRDERHMKALTSRIIRRVLVDQARQHNAQKRTPGLVHDPHSETAFLDPSLEVDVLDLDAALHKLAQGSERMERIVELRFFGGLTTEEAASELGISTRTAERDWQKARMYLLELLQPADLSDQG